MSDHYLHRLRKVRDEHDAARAVFALVAQSWYRPGFGDSIGGVSLGQIKDAEQNLQATYFIRLYAEFEGVLKDHLVSNHPAQAFADADRPKIDEVIARIVKVEGLTVNPKLRARLDAARDYRNSIAHARRTPTPSVSITDGIVALGKLLGMLPDPRT